jgi:transcriptional regulator with XRE-family HTH domain
MQDKKITRAKKVLDALRRHLGFKTYAQLADFLGVKQNTISSWISRDSLDEDLIYRKCKGLRYDWILTADGRMWEGYAAGVREPVLLIEEPEAGIHPMMVDKLINELLSHMTEEQKRDVLKYVEEKKLLSELLAERKEAKKGHSHR